ncbi:MAG: Antilisterial bacteriocin subtilosin biosynthesis protein AlbA [Chloroflexi bacterium ADurb.Bin325]|nr:MAG: Antilisterial bacteriocin subtilosin biosynthesis protein AlbA [Chloroflexi bacterium ADurb.Bin325]
MANIPLHLSLGSVTVDSAAAPDRGFPGCGAVMEPRDSYDALLSRLGKEHVPFTVLWELTHICNLNCIMCYNVPLKQPELSTAECYDILEQLAEAGTLRLILTGGEILSRHDFFDIAGRARELGFALDLKTNATMITPAIADRLAELAPVQVEASLLGATPETSDAVSGARHSLERVLRGVKLLLERGVRVKLNTLLLDLNVHERAQMLDLAQSLGVYYEQVLKVSPADDGSDVAGLHQLSLMQMADALVADQTPFTPRQPAPAARTCGVGLSSCLISPYGVVYPCIELRIPAGSLRRQPFREIWTTAPILQRLRANHTWANLPECWTCPINTYCEGRCAGIAWKEHGDLYGGHLTACQQAQARYAQVNPGQPIPQTPLQAKMGVAPAFGIVSIEESASRFNL